MSKEILKLSFAEAEAIDIAYYAKLTWEESVKIVEQMRKRIWEKEYNSPIQKVIRKAGLKEDRNDIE